MNFRLAANCSLVALALTLGACGGGSTSGGGGIGSTPTPTPVPTPTPSPSPSPTPTPTPTPTATNDDLLSPLVSESFTNVASIGTLRVPLSGANVTAAADPLTLTVSYNAANQSYTVSDSAGSRTFAPANIDAAQSGPGLTTYAITSGNTTEYLSLTIPGTGAGQLRYVGGGFWQKQVNGTVNVDGRFAAFAYGVETTNAGLPRTGVASFAVEMLGVRSFETLLYALDGTGTIHVDLQTGAMAGNGNYSETNVDNNINTGAYQWAMRGSVASASNGFTGSIGMDNYGSGELHGQFFGPAAEEIGAAFSIKNASNAGAAANAAAVGTLFGARTSTNLNQSTNLTINQTNHFFRPLGTSLGATLGGGQAVSATSTAPKVTAVFRKENGVIGELFSADGRITSPPIGGGTTLTYREFSEHSQYMRNGLQLDRRTPSARLDAVLYGFETAASAVPRTGSASFNIALNGGVAATGSTLRQLTGLGSMTANLATGAISTIGNYNMTTGIPGADSPGVGSKVESGTWNGSATLASAANAFTGTLALDGTTDFTGSLEGKFFGPAAEEVGAVFDLTSAGGARAVGTLNGPRGAGVGGSQTGLLNLTSPTQLQTSNTQLVNTAGLSPANSVGNPGNITITYDPAAGTYAFVTTFVGNNSAIAVNDTLTSAMVDAAASNATFRVYNTPTGITRMFMPGAANPVIALTYTSFFVRELTGMDSGGRAQTADAYIVYGGQTPSFQMPITGTATYSGVVYGNGYYSRFQRAAALSGTSDLSMNFGTGAAEMILALTATEDASGLVHNLGNFSYTGTLSGNCPGCAATSGNLSTFLGGNGGNMNLVFFGPSAAEFGATFNLNVAATASLPDQESQFAGATVGKRDVP